ncbi:MAG TPA: MoaD/ThiS family protein [Candidatus Azoamicus sp. OHIO1]
MLNIRLRFFGVFSDYFKIDLSINLNNGANLNDLRNLISFEMQARNLDFNFTSLLKSSVFSNEDEILADSYLLKSEDVIYLLPPVSGG